MHAEQSRHSFEAVGTPGCYSQRRVWMGRPCCGRQGGGCSWRGWIDRGHMADHGLSDSLAWIVMAGLSVAWRIFLWPAEFYGRPLRVVAVLLFGVFCCLASSSYLVLLSSFAIFSSSLLLVPDFLTRHSNNGFYKLPENWKSIYFYEHEYQIIFISIICRKRELVFYEAQRIHKCHNGSQSVLKDDWQQRILQASRELKEYNPIKKDIR